MPNILPLFRVLRQSLFGELTLCGLRITRTFRAMVVLRIVTKAAGNTLPHVLCQLGIDLQTLICEVNMILALLVVQPTHRANQSSFAHG